MVETREFYDYYQDDDAKGQNTVVLNSRLKIENTRVLHMIDTNATLLCLEKKCLQGICENFPSMTLEAYVNFIQSLSIMN